MKCPKCNYTSFDFNRVCPKCGNDTTEEQTRLNLSPNKPNPPFFLASLIGKESSENPEFPADGSHITSSGAAPEEMDAQELLIALDDLQPHNTQQDSPEPFDHSTDEIVFDTDDPKEDSFAPFESAEDDILFDLEPASQENEIESIGMDPLDKKGFSDFNPPDKKPGAVDAVEVQDETGDQNDEMDLFLADESGSPEVSTGRTGPGELNHQDNPDSQELLLSLDDLPTGEPEPDPSEPTHLGKDEIVFELEEPVNREEATADAPVEIENTHEEPPALFLEEAENITDNVDLLFADEPTPVLDENASSDIQNVPDNPDSQELLLSLDDLPTGEPEPDPSEPTHLGKDEIVFELEEPVNREEATAEIDAPDEKGFWDSDEIKKQETAYDLEEGLIKTRDASPRKTADENKDVNLFSDLDIEPLDLELSLDDIDKKP